MEEYLVVDGYNVLHSWKELEKLMQINLSHARDKLIDVLVEYRAMTEQKVIVVFDAHMVLGNQEHLEKINKIEVIYSKEGETADSVIEKLISSLIKKGSVFVVTSDGDEQFAIFGQGAYRITPQELLNRIKQLKKENESKLSTSFPSDRYLGNRLEGELLKIFEKWRRS